MSEQEEMREQTPATRQWRCPDCGYQVGTWVKDGDPPAMHCDDCCYRLREVDDDE